MESLDPNKIDHTRYYWERSERCNREGFYDPHCCRINPDISSKINLRASRVRWTTPNPT